MLEKREKSLLFASGMRESRVTGRKGAARFQTALRDFQTLLCQSKALLRSLQRFAAAMTLWLVYLSTMMAEG